MDPPLFPLSQPFWTSWIEAAKPEALCRNDHKPPLRQAEMTLEIFSRFWHMQKNYRTIEPSKMRRAASRDCMSESKHWPMLWREQLPCGKCNLCRTWHKLTAGSRTTRIISRRSSMILPMRLHAEVTDDFHARNTLCPRVECT